MADVKPAEPQPGAAPVDAGIAPAAAVTDNGAASPAVPADGAAVSAAPVEGAAAPVDGGEQPAVAEAPAEAPAEKPTDLLRGAQAPGEEGEKAEAEGEKAPEAAADAEKPVEPEPKKADESDKGAESAEGEKGAEAEQPEQPALEAIDYTYELPETLQMNDEQRTEFHGALDTFRANPADPTPLIEQGVKMMNAFAEQTRQQQIDVWQNTLETWRTQAMADEQIGGPAWKTSEGRIARMRDMFVSRHPRDSAEFASDFKAFNEMLDYTGVGNHPAMLRFLDNVARVVDEPAVPAITDVKPAPDAHRRKGGDVLYDRSNMNGRG